MAHRRLVASYAGFTLRHCWDSKGNLGVAYVSGSSVMFDYLDMETRVWTSEVVNSQSSNYFGAALAFDRFDNPVIASGEFLFYDPPITAAVPEPTSLLALLTGIGYLLARTKTT